MRVARQWRSISKENYKEFCKNHPDKTLTFIDWKNIISSYNEILVRYILETGEVMKLPAGLGEISIIKKKRKLRRGKNDEFLNLPVDWKKTKEKGKKVYILNYHTEGFFFGWKWFKLTAKFTQARYFYFKMCRKQSRLLKEYLISDNKYQHIYREWQQGDERSKKLRK